MPRMKYVQNLIQDGKPDLTVRVAAAKPYLLGWAPVGPMPWDSSAVMITVQNRLHYAPIYHRNGKGTVIAVYGAEARDVWVRVDVSPYLRLVAGFSAPQGWQGSIAPNQREATFTVQSLPAGGSVDLLVEVIPASPPMRVDAEIEAEVDYKNGIPELDKTNNTGTATILVEGPN